jgi:hypothetical protein
MTDEYIKSGLLAGTIVLCPFCSIPTELASGCNFVSCICKRGIAQKSEFCFQCKLPKYQPIDPGGPCCNDASHNSH